MNCKNLNVLFFLFLLVQSKLIFGQDDSRVVKDKNERAILEKSFLDRVEMDNELGPRLLILKSKTISIPPYLISELDSLVEKERMLFKYRLIHKAYLRTNKLVTNQLFENFQYGYKTGIDAYNYIPTLLEIRLQHQLQHFFASSLCISTEQVFENKEKMQMLSEHFKANWILNPGILGIDTLGNQVQAQLQLEIWEPGMDSLKHSVVVKSKKANLESALVEIVEKAESIILRNLLRDTKFKNLVRLNYKRIDSK